MTEPYIPELPPYIDVDAGHKTSGDLFRELVNNYNQLISHLAVREAIEEGRKR